MWLKIPFLALAFAVLAGLSQSAHANVTYSFDGITSNNPVDVATGEAQLSLTVSDAGGGLVNFVFSNSGPAASSITDLYFDDSVDPALFATTIESIDNSDAGVSFSELARPGNLRGGEVVGFQATRGLTADADAPRIRRNGVNPGESVGVSLSLVNGNSFGDVTTALANGSLRVGIRVLAFNGGGKESFVNNPGGGSPPAVPEPGSMAIFGIGLAGFLARRRKQKKDSETI